MEFDTPFLWTCPFCGRPVTITGSNYAHSSGSRFPDSVEGNRIVETHVVVCPNPGCLRATVSVGTAESLPPNTHIPGDVLQEWRLIPASDAQVFPEYVPVGIRNTYTEACLIRDSSPQASATLSRRALQGILRHFFDATTKAKSLNPNKKFPTLADEMNAVKDQIEPLTWAAIDAVRGVGNIGAHMEEDVNLIVDVEPNEAQLLIQLIERVVADWYVNDHERQVALERLAELGKQKQLDRQPAPQRAPGDQTT